MAEQERNREIPKTTSMRLAPPYLKALEYLARQDSHTNISAAMRKLVDQRMKAEIGRDWESVVQESSTAA